MYKLKIENGDNRLLEKGMVLFILRLKAKQQPEKYKTSEAKFNEKRQNLDSDSKNGKQNYKQNKYVKQTVQKCKIIMYSTYSVGYKASEATTQAACFALL